MSEQICWRCDRAQMSRGRLLGHFSSPWWQNLVSQKNWNVQEREKTNDTYVAGVTKPCISKKFEIFRRGKKQMTLTWLAWQNLVSQQNWNVQEREKTNDTYVAGVTKPCISKKLKCSGEGKNKWHLRRWRDKTLYLKKSEMFRRGNKQYHLTLLANFLCLWKGFG